VRIDPPDRLADAAVALRPMRLDDAAPSAAAFGADPELGVLLGFEQDPDEESVRSRVQGQAQRADEGKSLDLAIADPATDAFWGSVILHSFDWHSRRCEVGFWVVPAARRRGLGSGAVALALSWVFNDLELLRVEMTTTPENQAVPALARRLGFTREGVLRARNIERGRRVDIVWFGLLREEWVGAAGT
jgi:RimJ/RimL family protein N-acetyltransferase